MPNVLLCRSCRGRDGADPARPAARRGGYAAAAVIVITVFTAAVGARTIIAVARGQFLPARQEGLAPDRPGDQPHSSEEER